MTLPVSPIVIGNTPLNQSEKPVQGEYVTLVGEVFYRIRDFDAMEPFFMSIVSSSDHWLFIASTGGLSAGRVSPEQCLFPYYTVDKLTENSENTGNKAILLVRRAEQTSLWEPFSDRQRGIYRIERNIYKNITSTVVVFEENNLDLGLTYRYAWRISEKFGFVKTTWLINTGIQPARLNLWMVFRISCLPMWRWRRRKPLAPCWMPTNAASWTETGLAIFALNSTLTDLAEPSESLLATTVAQLGLDQADICSHRPSSILSAGKAISTRNGSARPARGLFRACNS